MNQMVDDRAERANPLEPIISSLPTIKSDESTVPVWWLPLNGANAAPSHGAPKELPNGLTNAAIGARSYCRRPPRRRHRSRGATILWRLHATVFVQPALDHPVTNLQITPESVERSIPALSEPRSTGLVHLLLRSSGSPSR